MCVVCDVCVCGMYCVVRMWHCGVCKVRVVCIGSECVVCVMSMCAVVCGMVLCRVCVVCVVCVGHVCGL